MASKSDSKNEFTFKNFFKYWFNHWLLIVILMVIGAVGGIYYTSTRPLIYTATSKILVYNPNIEQGSSASPYAQIKDLLINEKLVGEIDKKIDLSSIRVEENGRGVFEISVSDLDGAKAQEQAILLAEHADDLIRSTYSDGEDYEVTILQTAHEAVPSTTTTKNIFMTIIAVIAMAIIATIVIFIKFDFSTEK